MQLLDSIKLYKKIVFYSWQSNLPNFTNRGFIEDAISKAIKRLKKDSALQFDVALDRDKSEGILSLLIYRVMSPINEILNSWDNSILLDPVMFRTN